MCTACALAGSLQGVNRGDTDAYLTCIRPLHSNPTIVKWFGPCCTCGASARVQSACIVFAGRVSTHLGSMGHRGTVRRPNWAQPIGLGEPKCAQLFGPRQAPPLPLFGMNVGWTRAYACASNRLLLPTINNAAQEPE
jgi:hypothetical protein